MSMSDRKRPKPSRQKTECPNIGCTATGAMKGCLDLRKLAFPPAPGPGGSYAQQARPHLELLADWARERGVGSAVPDIEVDNVLWKQWQKLQAKLEEAAKRPPYAARWKDAGGTVIMRDVFTQLELYQGCHDFLYLYQMMATKTRNEAVVEGMGSVWDKVNAYRSP